MYELYLKSCSDECEMHKTSLGFESSSFPQSEIISYSTVIVITKEFL